jgi:hypothetical protein
VPEGKNGVHSVLFSLALIVFPGACRGKRELSDRSSVRKLIGFGVLADESDDGALIEAH